MANLSILFLLTLSICLVSCLNWIMEEPSFVLREIILRPSSLTEGNLLIGLDVQNPNRFDLTLKSFEYVLFLDNKEIGTGHLEKEILVPSLSTTQVQVSVAAKFKDLGGSLKTIIAGHDLPYKIEGKASIETTFGSRDFPLSKDGRTN
jgi:LEA14-like dessication related protein